MTAPRQPLVTNVADGVTEGVWREGDEVVKRLRSAVPVVGPWSPSSDPRSWRYWRREADVYETDLPARLGVRAPALVSSELTETGGVELRIAAVDGRTGDGLTVDDLAETARVLGRAQADGPVDAPFLSRGFLRSYATTRPADRALLADDAAWDAPLVAPFVDDAARRAIRRLHDSRDRLFAIAEALPRTTCHLDVFPQNIVVGDAGVHLIDWAFTGEGARGEDVGNLVPDSVLDLQVPAERLPELADRLPEAYLAGLRESGWRGDDRLVRLAIHASAVKYEWLAPRLLERAGEPEHARYGGAPADARTLFAARWAALALLGDWAAAALADAERLL